LNPEHDFIDSIKDSVFVLTTAFNEEETIGSVLDEIKKYFTNIVVVDDASGDATNNIAQNRGVFVLKHLVNRGKGAALQTGFEYCLSKDATYILLLDSDGQHMACELPSLLKPVYEGFCDVSLGSRFLGKTENMPFLKLLLLKGAIHFTWLTSGLKLSDSHNGMRAFSRKAAEKIRFKFDRFAYASDLYDQIKKFKLKYREVPVTIKYTNYSIRKGQPLSSAFKIVFNYLWEKLWA